MAILNNLGAKSHHLARLDNSNTKLLGRGGFSTQAQEALSILVDQGCISSLTLGLVCLIFFPQRTLVCNLLALSPLFYSFISTQKAAFIPNHRLGRRNGVWNITPFHAFSSLWETPCRCFRNHTADAAPSCQLYVACHQVVGWGFHSRLPGPEGGVRWEEWHVQTRASRQT